MPLTAVWAVALAVTGTTVVPSEAAETKVTPKRRAALELFEKKIRPALIEHCYECHAVDADDIGGGLLLDSQQGLLTGGDNGPAIVPGNAKSSLLIDAIEYQDLEMPPDEKLPPHVITDFKRWIAMGAADPRKQRTRTKTSPNERTESAETANKTLWSLDPITDPPLPSADSDWPQQALDHYVFAKLAAADLSPNPPANPRVMIRRLYFDLTGLPPSPAEVNDYASSPSQHKYEGIVDKLLADRAFGERWGRHWLDVVRYGESTGSSRDVLMLHAWRYRDYVIDALNADLPYDQFVTEQLAGDLMESDSHQQQRRRSIATGLLAIGSKSLNGGNLVYDMIDDQIDVTSKAILGLTVSCARCHDHKFDPIPTADYYSLAGIFLSTETRYGGGTNRPKNSADKAKVYLTLGDAVSQDIIDQRDAARKLHDRLQKQVASSRKRVASLTKDVPKPYQQNHEKALPDDLGTDTQKVIRQLRTAARLLKERQSSLADAKSKLGPEPNYALGVFDKKKITNANILLRGEKGEPTDEVPRGFLSAINGSRHEKDSRQKKPTEPKSSNAPGHSFSIDETESGRRQLAAWMTGPHNPLTARVMVNRIWQHLMGQGIVETVDNFGVSGLPPSDKPLLDHLATRFAHTHAWSVKAMIREIVTSATYQQSSEATAASIAADPDNRHWWRVPRRRLEAEAMRDAMLSVSELLDLEPLAGSLVQQIGEGEVGRNIDTTVLSQPMNHRSVYLPIIRGIIPEPLKLFDFPEPSNPQGRRDSSTTPTQALYLMNSKFIRRVAVAFAEDLIDSPRYTTTTQRVIEARLRCFGDDPSASQLARDRKFIEEATADQDGNLRLAMQIYCQALIASAPFRFVD